MIVTARRTTLENEPRPHGPSREIDLELATHLGIHSRGPRNTLLALVDKEPFQVRTKDNQKARREILSLKATLPMPWTPLKTRWTARGLAKEHEALLFVGFRDKYLELCGWSAHAGPWIQYLEEKGVKRTEATHDSLDFAINMPDLATRKISILLTRDQADKILVLGMP